MAALSGLEGAAQADLQAAAPALVELAAVLRSPRAIAPTNE